MNTHSNGITLTPEDREAIRGRVPLEDLARHYDLHLIPAGRKFKALCPFHQEKTPSFWIDVDKQFYYCFGCEAGGDVFRLVQELDHVGFVEAAEILARRAGIVLDRRPQSRDAAHRRLGLYDALEFAAEFYRRVLLDEPRALVARQYVAKRGIDEPTQARFRLGFAPPEWDALLTAARRAGHSVDALERAGLVRPRQDGSGHYDYFRARLMFPIGDAQGRVIGFGARTLGDEQPKYLNTPATPLFDKSQVLFALAHARAGIRREQAIAVVEGYTDAILAHQAGLDYFVASLGTAFTAENARALRRQAPRVYMIFDGDAAGQSAAERSLELLVGEDIEVRVYTVTDGKDPCDAVRALGGAEFRARIERDAVDLFEFKWCATAGSPEAARSPQARASAVGDFLRLVAGVKNPVTRRLILRDYSERLGLRDSDVEALLEKAVREGARAATRERRRDGGAPDDRGSMSSAPGRPPSAAASPRAGDRPLRVVGPANERAGNGVRLVGSAAGGSAAGGGSVARRESKPLDPLAEIVLECLFALPENAEVIWERAPAGLFAGDTGEALREAIADRLRARRDERAPFSGVAVARRLAHPEAHRVAIRVLSRLEQDDQSLVTDYGMFWQGCQRDLRRWEIQTAIAAIQRELEPLAAGGGTLTNGERQHELRREVTRLRKELKRK